MICILRKIFIGGVNKTAVIVVIVYKTLLGFEESIAYMHKNSTEAKRMHYLIPSFLSVFSVEGYAVPGDTEDYQAKSRQFVCCYS